MWANIDERYRREKGQAQQNLKKLQVHELEEFIIQCSKETFKTYLFLDALNESFESSRVLRSLLKLAQEGTHLQILMSSTEEMGYKSPLISFVTMEKANTAGDIKTYIEAYLQDNDRLCNLPASLKEFIKAELQSKANGMYESMS